MIVPPRICLVTRPCVFEGLHHGLLPRIRWTSEHQCVDERLLGTIAILVILGFVRPLLFSLVVFFVDLRVDPVYHPFHLVLAALVRSIVDLVDYLKGHQKVNNYALI